MEISAAAPSSGYVGGKEVAVSTDKGRRKVRFYLKRRDGGKDLAVVGRGRSSRHMSYRCALPRKSAIGLGNHGRIKSRRQVIDWLYSVITSTSTPKRRKLFMFQDNMSIEAEECDEMSPMTELEFLGHEEETSASATNKTNEGLVSSPASPPPSLSPSLLSSISTSSRITYEVFLSFRGPDTRKGFADCLYTRLSEVGIMVFRDNNDIRPGEKIDDALVESIKQSKISIPIISKDYASSRSCLMELAQMLECKKADSQSIIPIFYDIDPTELKHQCGCVRESFRKHKKRRINPEDISKYKQALREIAAMGGYYPPNTHNGHQGKLIKDVVLDVQRILKKNDLVITNRLVGIESHVPEVMRKLGIIYVNGQEMNICDKDVRVLKICGIPGVGKTALAKFVYNKIYPLFDGHSFLMEIRKNVGLNGCMHLQEKLISDLRKQERRLLSTTDEGTKIIANSFKNMKVLIFIDDVHDFDQIKYLVGDLSWFGPGSRILMTVGKKDILDNCMSRVADKYEVEPMKRHEALRLFRKHAFDEVDEYPLDEQYEYYSLSIDIVDTIEGIPLAIEVTASSLYKRKIDIWRDTLSKLKKKPEKKVEEAINLCYGTLDDEAKNIFLDIACFFSGMDKRLPSCMWHACQYHPSRGIDSLRDKCLVKIGENDELWMHSQLREYGREIVRREDRCPWKRSRIWDHDDALSTLTRKEIAENVEALVLTSDEKKGECFRYEGFGNPWSLRFLRLDWATIGWSSQSALSNLRWLDWQGCSEISELLNLHLENLVILDLSHSLVTRNSQVWGRILEKPKELKVLKLSSCRHLDASPDFHTSMYLERLVLERCCLLSKIGRSIGNLKNLVSLNLKFCKLVRVLPEELHYLEALEELLIDGTSICMINFRPASMKQLKILSACQCEGLACISDSIGHLKSLLSLGLDGAAIKSLPDSVGSLKKLQRLCLGNCRKLAELPFSIGNLELLEVMDLSSTMISRLHRSVKNLKNLKVLKMENTHLSKFPKEIKNLKKLEEMDLSQCKNLKGPIHCDIIKGLSSLKILRLSSTKISGLPGSADRFSDLQRLDLEECDQVRVLPILPPNLSILRWGSKKMRTVPDLSYLKNLKELYLGDITDTTQKSSSKSPQIGWVTSLVNLEILELCFSKITRLPENFSALQLRKLVLHYVASLDLRELPSSLSTLCLQHCTIQVPQFSKVRDLSELELKYCHLAKMSLEDLKLLELLKISNCSVQTLDGLENMLRLRKLTLFDCPSLSELPDRTKYKFEIDM
ncbi:disease resistance protein RUN1-like isoform X2 [Eucalyptus grandis]|uniref:disease resistance protein RUN1-like isoform X2 n=1 Tax=Eucalyptus grandis TaxID=71139 RepID=UPI0008A0B461|nr:disease resistance protein RUN1-like isoform X2 [Eucalyptus grandis]